ncbi:MAG: hypothetical protein M3016_09480, partial [Actinomycetota bacterium]|nr:hypothetical protein [Actinomycetota bacterium]
IFYSSTHTFMRIGNRYFGTSGFARPGGGAGWFSTDKMPVGYLDQFNEVHVPWLGSNSFARHRRHRHVHHGHATHRGGHFSVLPVSQNLLFSAPLGARA